ncbi:MAG: hypothetical protein SFT94_02515 [Pseudanabaenaceae cyanobacterium bins.68]|nr:hypothetical protein [Pseudanabaenaceae cyanobacterium bins.68]
MSSPVKTTATSIKSALECLDFSLDQELARYRHWRATGKTYSLADLAPEFRPELKPEIKVGTQPEPESNPPKSQTNPYLNLELPELTAPQPEPPSAQPLPEPKLESPKIEFKDQVLQNFTHQPITIKPSGFRLGSPLGILLLLLLCGGSSLLGYLLIDRLLPKLNPPAPPSPQPSPQSSWGTSDFSSPTVPSKGLQPSSQKNQPSLPALPQLDTGLNSIRAMLKNSAAPSEPAVSVRPYPALPSLPPPPAQMSAAPIVRSNTSVTSSGNSKPKITGEVDASINLIRDLAVPPKLEPQPRVEAPQPQPQTPVSPPVAVNRPAPLTTPANPIENAPVKYAPLVTAKSQPSAPEETRYAIVAPNRYLAEGKQVEKGAFVRPSDGQLQLGSFRDPEAAQRRIEELRQQGIPVDAIRVEAK